MKKNVLMLLLSVTAVLLPALSFGQVAPPLGAASTFVLFTATGAFDNVGPTVVSGDIGTNAGQFSGFPLGVQLTGVVHVADTYSTQAATDVQLAFNYLSGVPCVQPLAVLGGPPSNPQVLIPNAYCVGQSTTLAGNLILDGQNNPNATFFIRVGGALTTDELSTVTLINGATVNNVYWQVSGRVDLGRNSTFRGTLVVDGAINLIEGATLIGRGLSRQGAITLDSNTATLPAVSMAAWNGSVSTDWFTAANWTPAVVPTSSIDAYLVSGAPRYPVLTTGTAFSQLLNIGTGASFTQSGGTADVRSSWVNNGTFTATGGTVALSNPATTGAAMTLGGSSLSRFWNLSVAQASAQQTTTAAGLAVQRLLTLDGNLTTNGRPTTLLSDATGTAMIATTGGLVIGTATVQRYISPSLNAGLGYRQLASPVSGMTVAGLATANYTPVVNATYNTSATPALVTPFPTVFGYDESRLTSTTNNLAAFDKGWESPASLTSSLASGLGYTVNMRPTTVSFVGVPFSGVSTQSLTRGAGAEAGWSLVGNPYPAPLAFNRLNTDASTGPVDRLQVDASFYVFESTSGYAGNYRAYVNGVGGDSIIAVGQGFFVRVSPGFTSGTLRFRNQYRRSQYTDRAVLRGTANSRPLVQLDLQGAGLADPLYVYFENGATAGTDTEFDAVKLPNTHGLNLSAAAGPDQLAIQGLPLLSTTPVTVPLHLAVPATGTYTLHAAQLLNLSATHAYLRDRQTGTLTDLRTTPDYSFQLNAAYTGVRFELVFSSQAALAVAPASLSAQVAVFPNPAHAAVFVELPAALRGAATTATLLDALGRPVRTFTLAAGAATHTLPVADVAAGLYSLRVTTDLGIITKKLQIN